MNGDIIWHRRGDGALKWSLKRKRNNQIEISYFYQLNIPLQKLQHIKLQKDHPKIWEKEIIQQNSPKFFSI